MVAQDGASESGRRRQHALALVTSEGPGEAGQATTLAQDLHALCRAASSYFDATGAVVNLMTTTGLDSVVASVDPLSQRVGELTFTVGEGPALDAFTLGRPVLVPDLAADGTGHWVGYVSGAASLGVSAAYAVPLHVGAVRLGVFELYADRALGMVGEDLAMLLTFAALGTEMLLAAPAASPAQTLGTRLDVALDHRAEVHQAQGMVMVDLGVGLGEALVRMRAHAFSLGVPLIEVARLIIAGMVLPDGRER